MAEAGFGNDTQSPGCCEPVSTQGDQQATETPTCPMASICSDFTESPGVRYGSFLAGALFVAIGVLILVQPNFLVWLAGLTTILLGLLVSAAGFAVRRFGARLECCGAQ